MTFSGEKSFPGLDIAAPVPACDLEVQVVDGGHYYEEEIDLEDCTSDSEEVDDEGVDEEEAPESEHVLRDSRGKPIIMDGKSFVTPIPVSRISTAQRAKLPDWILDGISPGITKEDENE